MDAARAGAPRPAGRALGAGGPRPGDQGRRRPLARRDGRGRHFVMAAAPELARCSSVAPADSCGRWRMEHMEGPGLTGLMTLGGTSMPLVGRARVYACGITPYDVTHLGHAAAFVWIDTLSRVLREAGAEVIICRNVTDVDDVLLAAAERAGSPYDRFAAIQQFYFDRDMAALGVGQPALQPRAHAYIGQVIALAAGLLDRGAAYERG